MQVQFETTEQDVVSSVEPYHWHGISLLEKLIIVFLPLLALFFAVLPFLDQALLLQARQAGGLRPFVDWLVNSGGAWIMAAAIAGLWVAYLLIKRSRLVNNQHLWVDAGCPQCQERELIRVSRERSDRFYNLLGIPVFRYACRNCTWRGLRIGRRHRPFYADPIAEELALAAVAAGQGEMLPAQPAALAATEALQSTDGTEVSEVENVENAEEVDLTASIVDVTDETMDDFEEEVEVASDTVVEAVDNHVAASGESGDDDLDWLWKRLNDEQ